MIDDYSEVSIKLDSSDVNVVIALLTNIGFDSFWEKDEGLMAYIKASNFDEECQLAMQELSSKFNFQFDEKILENKNWNEAWESNFSPVLVENYCYVKADFHTENKSCKHTITINPKMAFGTAHHETTFMMIQQMISLEMANKKIVDFGCGTAILSILAAKEDAKEVIAFDYDENAILNAKENIEINQIHTIRLFMGDIGDMGNQKEIDVVLANINRSVLMSARDEIHSALNDDGILLMSGILKSDAQMIEDYYGKQLYFDLIHQVERGEWICLTFKKTA